MLICPQPCQAKLLWLVKRIASRHPEVLYFADTRDSVLALTIDDSPDSATTPQLLEVLREYDVHATFFWPSTVTGALSDRCTPSTRLSGPSASRGASSSGLPIREGSSSSTTVAHGESGRRRSCVRCCLS